MRLQRVRMPRCRASSIADSTIETVASREPPSTKTYCLGGTVCRKTESMVRRIVEAESLQTVLTLLVLFAAFLFPSQSGVDPPSIGEVLYIASPSFGAALWKVANEPWSTFA